MITLRFRRPPRFATCRERLAAGAELRVRPRYRLAAIAGGGVAMFVPWPMAARLMRGGDVTRQGRDGKLLVYTASSRLLSSSHSVAA